MPNDKETPEVHKAYEDLIGTIAVRGAEEQAKAIEALIDAKIDQLVNKVILPY